MCGGIGSTNSASRKETNPMALVELRDSTEALLFIRLNGNVHIHTYTATKQKLTKHKLNETHCHIL